MSTYARALSPANTEAGSDSSLLSSRLSCLWGGGTKQSIEHTCRRSQSQMQGTCIQSITSMYFIFKRLNIESYILEYTPQYRCKIKSNTYYIYDMKCISTYRKALRPLKTNSGSDTSWLEERSRWLWGGGKTESGLHWSPSQRLRVYVSTCVRVSLCVRAYLKKQPRQSSAHTTTVIDMQMQGICI